MAKKKKAKKTVRALTKAEAVKGKRGRPKTKKFEVTVECTQEYEIIVCAKDESDAKRQAVSIVEGGNGNPIAKHIRTERCWERDR